MNVLHSIVKVTFTPLPATEAAAAAPAEQLKVVSRQLLTFRLTIVYDNTAEDAAKEQAVKAFLSMIGVHSLEAAWAHLFGAVQVVPFLLCRGESPARASPPLQSSSPASSDGWGDGTAVFVKGTPRFWSAHRYRWQAGGAAAQEHGGTPLQGSATELYSPAAVAVAAVAATAGMPTSVPTHSLPMVTATASPSFVNHSNDSRTTHSRRGSAVEGEAARDADAAGGVRCEVIGGVATVAADAGSPRRLPAADAGFPHLMESSFTVELALPDFEAASLRGVDTALAMVVLLPLCAAPGGGAVTGGGGGGADDQPSILRSVLARSVGQTQVEAAAASALVLGSGVVPVRFTESFVCVSSTSPLSNDRLVLNLSLTNVTASAARLYSTSFDLHSSCVLPDGVPVAGGGWSAAAEAGMPPHITASPLWGEVRPGANLSSMRTIDLLTKLVTITPVVVGEERPPVVLYPGETYSFEFVIEVLPQLCYLLNPQSLEYLYERHYAVPHGGGPGSGDGAAGGGGRRSDGAGGGGGAAATFGHGSVVADCYGEAVSAAELRGILSHSYLSHLFVYYDLVAGDGAAGVSGSALDTGLYLRYPARWSFGA